MLNTYLVSFLDCLGLFRIHIFVKCKKTQIVFGQNIFKANFISFKSCGRYEKVNVSISFFLLLFIVNSQKSQLKKINFTLLVLYKPLPPQNICWNFLFFWLSIETWTLNVTLGNRWTKPFPFRSYVSKNITH